MKTTSKKFLEFNGKTIFFVDADGKYWIAIKPICEALNVEYTRQFKNLKKDKILGAVLATQPMQAPDNQTRNYTALPEFYVYGWLMQIQLSSPELLKYKWECYGVLYNHFHGAITGRKELLVKKAEQQNEINKILNKLDPNEAINLDRAGKTINKINANLRGLDYEVLAEQQELLNE